MKIKLKDKVFDYRFATKKDINRIYRFDTIINNDKEDSKYYICHNKQNLRNRLLRGNKIYLVFFNNRLVAWATLFLDIKQKYLSYWNLSLKDSKKSGLLAAAAVSKKYRGHGIQNFLIKKRIEYLKKKNKKFAFVGVSPENKYSLNNIKSFGFKFIKKVVIKHPKLINKKKVMCDVLDYNYRLKL